MNKYIVYSLLAAILVVALLGLRGTTQPLGTEGDGNLTLLTKTGTYDPASLADGVIATTTLSISGVSVGDLCEAGFTTFSTTGGIHITCQVSAAGTALITFDNESGVTQDLASGVLRATVNHY